MINLTQFNPEIYQNNKRLFVPKKGEIRYEEKKRVNFFKRILAFTGISNRSLHKVIKTAVTISQEYPVQDDRSEEELSNLKSNLEQMESIRSAAKRKFPLPRKLFYCKTAQPEIEHLEHELAPELALEIDVSEYDTAPEESSLESEYCSLEEEMTDHSRTDYYSQEETIVHSSYFDHIREETQSINASEEAEILPTTLNGNYFSYIQAMEVINECLSSDEITQLLTMLLPKDIISWEMNENYEFTLEFEHVHSGEIKKIPFHINQVIKGKLDPDLQKITFEKGHISGQFLGMKYSLLELAIEMQASQTQFILTAEITFGSGVFSVTRTKTVKKDVDTITNLLTTDLKIS